MDLPLVGTLVLAALAVPYTVEVFYQVWLQAKFLAVIPADVRNRLPRHPRRPWLSFFASLRFQVTVLRYALRPLPEDSSIVLVWKGRMRASMIRESIVVSALRAERCDDRVVAVGLAADLAVRARRQPGA